MALWKDVAGYEGLYLVSDDGDVLALPKEISTKYSKNKAIEQYFDGEKIAEYKSIKYASELTGISRTAINNALTGYSMTAGGYKWKYCDLERSDDLSH